MTYAHNAGHGDEPPIVLADHERAHVYQYMVLGPLFLPLYLLCGGISARNRFERAADRYAGFGRGWWPWCMPRLVSADMPTTSRRAVGLLYTLLTATAINCRTQGPRLGEGG